MRQISFCSTNIFNFEYKTILRLFYCSGVIYNLSSVTLADSRTSEFSCENNILRLDVAISNSNFWMMEIFYSLSDISENELGNLLFQRFAKRSVVLIVYMFKYAFIHFLIKSKNWSLSVFEFLG